MKNFSGKMTALIALLWVLLSAAAQVSGDPALWGLLPLGSLSTWWVMPATAVSALFLIAVLAGKEEVFTGRKFEMPGRTGRVLVALGGIVLLWAAWELRSRNHFMGDGFSHLSNVSKDFFLRPYEPLDFFLHQLLQRGYRAIGLNQDIYAYWITHLALLPVYLFVLWRLARRVTEKPQLRAVVFAMLASTGTFQLFAGYVETYTFVNLLLAVYFLLALRDIGKKKPAKPWWPTVVLLLAAGFHLSAIVFAPTLLFLWLENIRGQKDSGLKSFNFLLVTGLSATGGLVVLLFADTELVLPLKTTVERAYTLLSAANLWDKINLLTFVLPALGVLILMFIQKSGQIYSHRSRWTVFLVLAAICALGFAFVFDPQLGIRDWDIFALTALPLVLLGVWVIDRFFKCETGHLLLAGLALGSCVHLGTLLSINSVERRGLSFLMRMAVHEQHHGANMMQMGTMLTERDYKQEAIKLLEMVRGDYRSRADINLAALYMRTGQPARAVSILDPYFYVESHKQKDRALLLNLLMIANDLSGDPEKASDYFLRVLNENLMSYPAPLQFYIEHTKIASMRNNYWLQYGQDSPPAGVLMFFFRYYALVERDINRISEVYQKIATGEFTVDQWTKFIGLSYLLSDESRGLLIEQASNQYPQAKSQFSALAEKP